MPSAQVPAHAVVQAAWSVLQQNGWDHPAWREAYSLGQLCLAAAYSIHDSTNEAPYVELQQSNSTLQTTQSSIRTAQGPKDAELCCQRVQGQNSQGQQASCNPSSVQLASTGQGSTPQDIHNLGKLDFREHAMQAMQALDLASIMGAPADMLAPVLETTEPAARQAHQTYLSQNPRMLKSTEYTPRPDGRPSAPEEASELAAGSEAGREQQGELSHGCSRMSDLVKSGSIKSGADC